MCVVWKNSVCLRMFFSIDKVWFIVEGDIFIRCVMLGMWCVLVSSVVVCRWCLLNSVFRLFIGWLLWLCRCRVLLCILCSLVLMCLMCSWMVLLVVVSSMLCFLCLNSCVDRFCFSVVIECVIVEEVCSSVLEEWCILLVVVMILKMCRWCRLSRVMVWWFGILIFECD